MARARISAEAASWIIKSSRFTKAEIKNRVSKAAREIWPRVLVCVRRELSDSGEAEKATLALEVWEATLTDVLQSMQRMDDGAQIEDLGGYLYAAFVRQFVKGVSRERRLQKKLKLFPTLDTLAALKGAEDHKWVKNLEEELLIKEVLELADKFWAKVIYRRWSGDSWDDIAQDLGMTSHQLKMRFRYHIEKLRREVLGAGKPASNAAQKL